MKHKSNDDNDNASDNDNQDNSNQLMKKKKIISNKLKQTIKTEEIKIEDKIDINIDYNNVSEDHNNTFYRSGRKVQLRTKQTWFYIYVYVSFS
jgi:hypothetical protein